MRLDMQNGGLQPAASRNQLDGWLQLTNTTQETQAQMIAGRFCPSPSVARGVAQLCFGEAQSD